VAVGRPQLELGIAGRPQLQQRVVAAIVEFDTSDALGVASVERLREAQHRGQRTDRPPRLLAKVDVAVVLAFRRGAAVVARDQRDHLDFPRLETAQVAVLDQVVRVAVMPLVAHVDADIVEDGGVLEPFPLLIGQSVNAAGPIEEQ